MPIEVTPIGLVFALALGVSMIVQPQALVWVLSIAIPFSHTAMFIVGSNGISPFWVTAVAAVCRLIYLAIRRGHEMFARLERPRTRGALAALIGFGAYSTIITVLGPALFHGTPVISPRGGLDSQIDNFTPLAYTTSNVAQLAYLITGIGLVIYFIVERPLSKRVLEGAIIVGFALALFKHLLPELWPQDWFDSNPSYTYHWIRDTARERGSFAEPSLLGMFVSTSLTYLVSACIRATWRTRVLYAVLIAAGVYLYLISYTGTALLSIGTVALLGIIVSAVSMVRRASVRTRWIAAGAAGASALLLALFWGVVYKYTIGLAVQKLTTDSFANRTASNENSWQVLLDSFGLGVGLGSDRPSSLFFMLLSCTGVIGTFLILRTVSGFTLIGLRDARARPMAWAMVAQIVAQIVAKPDLSMPATWFLIGALATSYNSWATAQPHVALKPVSGAAVSMVTWIPREIRYRPSPSDGTPSTPTLVLGDAGEDSRQQRRRARVLAKHHAKTKILALVGLITAVVFFGMIGYGGYSARAAATTTITSQRAQIGDEVSAYEQAWETFIIDRKNAVASAPKLRALGRAFKGAFTTDPEQLKDFRAKVQTLTLITGAKPGDLRNPSAYDEMASYTPLAAGLDTREIEKLLTKYKVDLATITAANTAIDAAIKQTADALDAALDSLRAVIPGVLSSAAEVDPSLYESTTADAFTAALDGLGALADGADLDTIYAQVVALMQARDGLRFAAPSSPPHIPVAPPVGNPHAPSTELSPPPVQVPLPVPTKAPEPTPAPGTDPGTVPVPGTDPGPGTGTNPGTDPDAGTDPGTDPGSGTGTNPGTDPDAGSEAALSLAVLPRQVVNG